INIDDRDSVKTYKYYGSHFSGATGSIGVASSFYGRNVSSSFSGAENDGTGRWIYRDDAPYILTTYAEIQFCLAEAYWKLNQKTQAFQAFKSAVAADMETSARYIYPGKEGSPTGGGKSTKDGFGSLASEYLNGTFVGNLGEL